MVPEPDDAVDGLVYVALQELATRIAHRNTGRLLEDRAGYEVMARVAADENLHYLFYRDLASAALELDPSAMVHAIERQVRDFEMPGTGIPDFEDHARPSPRPASTTSQIHHEQILVPVVLRHWDVEALEGLDAEAEQARDRLLKRIERIGRAGRRLAERWARRTSPTRCWLPLRSRRRVRSRGRPNEQAFRTGRHPAPPTGCRTLDHTPTGGDDARPSQPLDQPFGSYPSLVDSTISVRRRQPTPLPISSLRPATSARAPPRTPPHRGLRRALPSTFPPSP